MSDVSPRPPGVPSAKTAGLSAGVEPRVDSPAVDHVFEREYRYTGADRHNLADDLLAATALGLDVDVRTVWTARRGTSQPRRLVLTVTKAQPAKPGPDSESAGGTIQAGADASGQPVRPWNPATDAAHVDAEGNFVPQRPMEG